jgi:cytochrome c peroxidase
MKITTLALFIVLMSFFNGVNAADCPNGLPEYTTFEHIEHADIFLGKILQKDVIAHGEKLFNNKFNSCDGVGRPATTGTGMKRIHPNQPEFIRTSGMDSNSCSGCHNQPRSGGAGDFVANVFVLAQAKDPVTFDISSDNSNERNTLGMNGSGLIEMAAREMTAELKTQAAALNDGPHILTSKGVSFNIVKQNGVVINAEGIDTDLVVKPFHQAGVVVSIRQFTVNAFNHHHGMQAEERFDLNPDKGMDSDFDEDSIHRELTIGDVTATTLWQATLSTPIQVLPKETEAKANVKHGEKLFHDIGCVSCHTPVLPLNTTFFTEPNPYNPADTFKDQSETVSVDLKTNKVKAYTDLKRHNLCDNDIRFFCNEKLNQGRPDQNGKPGYEYFITRKLWDIGSSAPYGHRGDLTTISEAILMHGGEGRQSRDNFINLSIDKQRQIVAFLNSLKIK